MAGGYEAYGRLLDTQGRLLNESVAPFTIGAPASLAATGVTTDKQIYDAWDSVNINGRVQNTAANAILPASRVEITVKNPAGETLYFDTRRLGEMAPGALTDLPFGLRLSDAATGQYPVTLVLKDEFTRAVLSTSTTTFQVQRRALQGVVGAVQVTAQQVYIGDPDACTETAKNVSATMISGLKLIHQLVNMDAGVVVDEISEVIDLPAGGVVHSYFRNIDTGTLALGGYACVIKADLGGDVRTLAFGGFNIVEPPIRINAGLSIAGKGRLLVLLDPPKHCEHDSDRTPAKSTGDSSDDDCKYDRDPHGPKDAPLLSAQRAFLEKFLKDAGWSYTITEQAADFTRELRTGGYATYALFAEHEKLDETAQKELRAAVLRGEGLLVAGAHDNRHHGLKEALGIKQIGHVSHAIGVDIPAGPLGVVGQADLLAKDKALRIKRLTAQSLASYLLEPGKPAGDKDDRDDCRDASSDSGEEPKSADGKPKSDSDGESKDDHNDECEGRPEQHLDAATINSYGNGRAVWVGFDLLATATRDEASSLSAQAMLAALQQVTPAISPNLTAGQVAPVTLKLVNQGIATPVRATLTLPAGARMVDAGAAHGRDDQWLWDVELGVGAQASLTVWVRLPETPGTVGFRAIVEAPVGGTYKLIAAPALDVTTSAPPESAVLEAMMQALIEAGVAERKELERALKYLEAARKHLPDKPEQALHEALKAGDALGGLTSSEILPIRIELARWIGWLSRAVDVK